MLGTQLQRTSSIQETFSAAYFHSHWSIMPCLVSLHDVKTMYLLLFVNIFLSCSNIKLTPTHIQWPGLLHDWHYKIYKKMCEWHNISTQSRDDIKVKVNIAPIPALFHTQECNYSEKWCRDWSSWCWAFVTLYDYDKPRVVWKSWWVYLRGWVIIVEHIDLWKKEEKWWFCHLTFVFNCLQQGFWASTRVFLITKDDGCAFSLFVANVHWFCLLLIHTIPT